MLEDICTKYITPAIEKVGWGRHCKFLQQVSFTDGRIYVKGRMTARRQGKRADYILYHSSNATVIIEAKGDVTVMK